MTNSSTHSFPSRACAGALAAFLGSVTPSIASAQQQSPDASTAAPDASAATPADMARVHFETGVAAMQRQDYTAALAAFEESMRMRRAASVALNLGVVLHQLGRLVEARVRLQEFNELATPQARAEHATRVTELLTSIARRLGRVRFVELAPPAAVVSIDGRRAQLNDTGETVVDPGAHTVRVEATGHLPFEERVEVGESATREMRVTLPTAPTPVLTPVVTGPVTTPHPPQPVVQPESPFYTRWWFWTAIGVVVAAGATTAIVLATADQGPTVRALPTSNTGVTIQGLDFGGWR